MSCVSECRKYLKQKLLDRPFEGYEAERTSLLTMMQRTIDFGESNSVLVIGPSGTGKTMMIESVLDEIVNTKEYDDRYCIVQLHGLLHTDDKIAFNDICKQLKVKFEVEENSKVSSDTLMKMLQDLSSEGEGNFKSVIFVLEDFHYFCDHISQNLLYILFDTAQAKKVPVFVVGITTQFNVVELLEKRVLSRFSGNCIRILTKSNFKERVSQFIDFLTLEKNACSDASFVERWNKNIKKLSSNAAVMDLLKELLSISNDERSFINFLFYTVSQISEKNPDLTKNNLKTAFEMFYGESSITLLKSLSTLELCLIISCHHQNEIYDGEPFNFEMIYQRYQKFARSASAVPSVSRQIAYQAFETLVKLQLIAPFSSENSESEPREYIFHRLLISNQDIQDAIRTYPNLVADVRLWAENSLS